MFKVNVGYPARNEELDLANRMLGDQSPEAVLESGAVNQVLSADRILSLRAALHAITVREELIAYIVDLVRATREHEAVLVGGPACHAVAHPRQPRPCRAGHAGLRHSG